MTEWENKWLWRKSNSLNIDKPQLHIGEFNSKVTDKSWSGSKVSSIKGRVNDVISFFWVNTQKSGFINEEWAVKNIIDNFNESNIGIFVRLNTAIIEIKIGAEEESYSKNFSWFLRSYFWGAYRLTRTSWLVMSNSDDFLTFSRKIKDIKGKVELWDDNSMRYWISPLLQWDNWEYLKSRLLFLTLLCKQWWNSEFEWSKVSFGQSKLEDWWQAL